MLKRLAFALPATVLSLTLLARAASPVAPAVQPSQTAPLAAVAPVPPPPVVGGFAPTTTTNKQVAAAAAFAVRTQQQAMQDAAGGGAVRLRLAKILSAEEQVVAGMNYRLQLQVKHGKALKNAEALVWWQAGRKPEEFRLTSWAWKEAPHDPAKEEAKPKGKTKAKHKHP